MISNQDFDAIVNQSPGLFLPITQHHIKSLVDKLNVEFELQCGIYFGKSKVSCYSTTKKRIRFGAVSIERAHTAGFTEYKSLQPTLKKYTGGTRVKGLDGITWLAMHEFSHALQHDVFGYRRGSIHNDEFLECYLKVISFIWEDKNHE